MMNTIRRGEITVVSENSTTFKETVAASKRGDTDAFREIFDALNDEVFGYACKRAESRDDALDIVQETFIALWDALPAFRYSTDNEFYGFVYVVLKRKIFKYRNRVRQTLPLDERSAGGESYELEYEDHRRLLRHVSSLATKYKKVISRRYWRGMSFAEIAADMGVTENTAKVRHHRAIKKLRRNIE